MACNSCAKSFSILRKEKGCPSCGFSYCSNCLNNKVFLKKLNSEVKVCKKCQLANEGNKASTTFEPPDAYYKRLANIKQDSHGSSNDALDKQIQERLQKLKEHKVSSNTSEEEIVRRLQNIKGELPSTSDAEIQERLARLRGMPLNIQSKTPLPAPDLRTEQEQANDLLRQYMEQSKIDSEYKKQFHQAVDSIEARLLNLKAVPNPTNNDIPNVETEDNVNDIVAKILKESKQNDELEDSSNAGAQSELPFCEICNEDAKMRCLGCKYLFCKICFLEHKDDDDGCNKYELYTPPH